MPAQPLTVEVYARDVDTDNGPQVIFHWPADVPLPRPGDNLQLPPPSPIGSGRWEVLSVGYAISFGERRSTGILASIEIDLTRRR
jgi:hypothetical protein